MWYDRPEISITHKWHVMLTDGFTDNIRISVRNLKRLLARLQLYSASAFSTI